MTSVHIDDKKNFKAWMHEFKAWQMEYGDDEHEYDGSDPYKYDDEEIDGGWDYTQHMDGPEPARPGKFCFLSFRFLMLKINVIISRRRYG